MRRKQLFAIILAGALAAGSAPAAVFAAESDVAAMAEEGGSELGSEDAGSEEGSSDAESGMTDGGDAAGTTDAPADNTSTDETPTTDNTAADNTSTDNTPAAEDTTTDTTPAAEAQTQEQTGETNAVATQDAEEDAQAEEDTGIVIADATGNPVKGEDGKVVYYNTLQEAVEAVANYDKDANPNATTIQISKPIVLDSTVEISGKKVNIQSTAADVTITRKTEGEAFTGAMFSVKGANSQLQFFADGSDSASLTVSGELPTSDVVEADATGAIVDVQNSGTFCLNSGVTLTGNNYADGGSAINCKGGKIVLAGGTVTNNDSGAKGTVYSDTDISMEGDASVSGNVDNKNIYLDGNAKLTLTKVTSVLAGKSTFTHINAKDGLGVITGTTDMTKDEFAAAIKHITYDDTNYEYSIGEDGYSVTLKKKTSDGKDDNDKTDYSVSYKSGTKKWLSHTSAQAKFTVTGDCEWAYIVVNTKSDGKYSISSKKLSAFTKVKANTEFTVKAENIPEGAATILVVTRLNSSDKNYKHASANLSESSRPAKPQATVNTRPASTPKVTEGTVTGFEDSIKFFPGKVYTFTPIGAGQENQNPVTGDERWIPQYWTFSTSSEAEHHTKWQISAPKGQQLKGKGSVTYTIYIYCQKQVYNGKKWVDTDVVQPYKSQFTAVEYTDKELANYYANLSGTPTPDDADGTDGGDGGDGGTDAELTATAAASAKDAGSKSKSAVSTADESPIGTMSVLAALSLLAGGYVVVRKRKKEEI